MNSLRTLSRASCRTSTFTHFSRALTTSTTLPVPPKPKAKAVLPVSAAPAGSVLKGIQYIKGRDELLAKAEEEYPEWLWKCLETEKKGTDGDMIEGDEFSKSKKTRRLVAKRQRKLEAKMIASGNTEAFEVKIPIQQQTIDLPSNEQGSVEGALEAAETRDELRQAMRVERRKTIKEANFLKGMK